MEHDYVYHFVIYSTQKTAQKMARRQRCYSARGPTVPAKNFHVKLDIDVKLDSRTVSIKGIDKQEMTYDYVC